MTKLMYYVAYLRSVRVALAAVALLVVGGVAFGGCQLDAPPDVDNRAVETITPAPTPTYTPSTKSSLNPAVPVVQVVDGDTLKVREDGEVVTLRLIGVDTPETRHPGRPVQCFGPEATAEARRLVAASGGEVRLGYDLSQDAVDRYGRELVYVWLRDGTLLNERLVRGGFAKEYTYEYPYAYQRWFLRAQVDAHDARRGLWAAERSGGCGGDTE